jgi:aryl carrier-like protein
MADYPLAFEANLSLDSRRLDLMIVAQGSVITKSGAADLLQRFRNVLNETIQNFGKNILSQFEDERIVNGINGRHVPDGEYSITPREPFTWTKNAHYMRQEIAMLAKVSKDTIHEHSSIFELGLDSIDVIKLSSRLKKRGIEISVSAIIKSKTIGRMSQNICIKDKKDPLSSGKSMDAMSLELSAYLDRTGKLYPDVEMVLPATPLQQSMVNEMIKSRYARYFNVDAFKLSAGVDPKRLMAAVKKTVEQSPILRTTFVEVDDPKLPVSFAQIVHREPDSSNSNFSICKSADEQTIEDFMRHFQSESKDLAAEKNALLQVHCVLVGLSQYLVIAISHALYDGTSLRFIHEDIQQAYHGELKLRPDFMPFSENIFQSTTEEAKKFWRTTLSNLPAARFPRKGLSDRQDGSLTTRLERRSRVPLQRMEELCKSSRTTMQTLGQTCWALVLSHLIGQLDVVFGSVLSCRDSEEASKVMFPLMNTVAVRAVPHGSVLDMLRYMQEMSDTTRQYQHFPLGTAQAYAMASRQSQFTSDATLFDTLFIYQGRRSTAGSDKLYESVYGNADVEFPVCAEMEIVDDKYVSWTIACKSFAAVEAEEIVEALEIVLEHILTHPEAQTLASDAEGISICGLPKFKKAETMPSKASARSINGFNDEWSTGELTIRKALHEISDIPEDAIRKDSTIFHLGLDSILILKLPALLKKYGIKLSVSDILREQTVYAMAKAAAGPKSQVNGTLDLDSILAASVPSEALSSVLGKIEKKVGELQHVMPVTAGELYMIRQWQASRGAMFYQTFTYNLAGPINKRKLEAAWSELLRRHDIFRTGFLEAGTDIVQVVFKNPPNEIIYDPEDNDWRIRKHRKDLTLPPLNLVVDKIDSSSVILRIVLHHALYDGISLPILLEELQSLYQGRFLSEPSIGFRTFIAQSISASSPNLTKDKWQSYLQHETLYPTPSIMTKRRQRTEVFHPLYQVSNVKKLAQDSDVSIDALFLASVAKLYAHKLGSSFSKQVVFGIYLANRAPFGEDLSNLAAPTLNLLPLRVRDPLSRSIQELAKEVQKDIHEISSKEMVSASLAEIYTWTGVRVNCFVNILKSVNPSPKDTTADNENEWLAVHHLGRRAEVVAEVINDEIEVPNDERCDAYLVCFFKIE